jgi:hypothetical protein
MTNQSAENLSPKQLFQSIQVLYYSLLAGQLIIAAVFVVLNNSDDGGGMFAPIEFGESQMYILIAGGLLIGCQVLARYIYYMRKNGISDLKDLKEKVGHYRSSVIARSGLMEGANLIALIFFFLEGNTLFLLIFAIGLAGFLLFRPSLHEFETDYPVSTEEQRALK